MRPRHRALLAVVLLLTTAGTGLAQSRPIQGSGFMFAAGGGAVGDGTDVGVMHFGLGGELFSGSRLGLAAELGHVISMANVGSGLSIFSPGVIYRFSRAAGRTLYLTGGYSLFFQGTSEAASGLHVGAGMLLWKSGNRGFRFEGRAQLRPEGDLGIYEIRVSRAFR